MLNSPAQLPIGFDEPTVEQLSLRLDASDPGSAYSARLRQLFEDTVPWRERRLEILKVLDDAEQALAPRLSPRLRYFRARLEDNDAPNGPPDVIIARWTAV